MAPWGETQLEKLLEKSYFNKHSLKYAKKTLSESVQWTETMCMTGIITQADKQNISLCRQKREADTTGNYWLDLV